MAEYVIRETEDWYPLSVLFYECGMEVEIGGEEPKGLVKMWRMDDAKTGEIMAGATLEIRDHVHTLGELGVRPDLQKKGYGKIMQEMVFEEARARGVTELWANAKVPEYYQHVGWEIRPWEVSPKVSVSCHSCSRRGTECFPEVIHIDLTENME